MPCSLPQPRALPAPGIWIPWMQLLFLQTHSWHRSKHRLEHRLSSALTLVFHCLLCSSSELSWDLSSRIKQLDWDQIPFLLQHTHPLEQGSHPAGEKTSHSLGNALLNLVFEDSNPNVEEEGKKGTNIICQKHNRD